MDHIRLLNQIREKDNIEKAFNYALNERLNCDCYFDYFEIDYIRKNKEKVINEILEELAEPENYKHRPAYAYYPPKSKLCNRRMLYIPFKDLVVRYAFLIIIADCLNDELLSQCFANRRAQGKHAKQYFLEHFASHSWPKFCQWQKNGIEKYNVLVKTDISSFYDSISHEYLIKIIAEELSIDFNTQLMQLFRKLLNFKVISYSQLSKTAQSPEEYKQGLPIGNNTEGFLANIYLKKIDEAMQIDGIGFARYNDDMRIFAYERKDAMNAILVLQQLLLSKGLNLNASKTKLAENKKDMDELRSKNYEAYEYHIVEDQGREEGVLVAEIDRNFDEFERTFEKDEMLKTDKDAKEYCKFISTKKSQGEGFLDLSERDPEHIEKLGEILIKWKGSSRHATWLIVQSAFCNKVLAATQKRAKEILFSSLRSDEINAYAKYRLLHHLVKLRKNKERSSFCYLNLLTSGEKNELEELLPDLLKWPAFELNIVSLWLLRILGKTDQEIREYVKKFIPKPVGEPIKTALSYISAENIKSKPIDIVAKEEPDNTVASY